MLIDIAFGKHRGSTRWKNNEIEWDSFVEMCSETTRTYEKLSDYFKFPKPKQDQIKDVGSYCSGLISGGKVTARKKDNVVHKQVLTLDVDHAPKGFWKHFQQTMKCAAFAYTTHKHTPDNPRWRLNILVNRPLQPEEYEPVCRRVAEKIGIDYFDPTSYDLNRLMHFPSTSKDGLFHFRQQDGKPLNADKYLDTYHDYMDVSEWPTGESENELIRTDIKQQGDPLEKPGMIGAFCRTYSITRVMDEILSHVYEQDDRYEDRYTYIEGTGSSGVRVYDDKFSYSEHATDPASKKNCNAYDLVRIHLFGKLDEKADADTPTSKLPSTAAMADYVLKDKEVVALMTKERFAATSEDFKAYFDEEAEEVEEVPRKGKKEGAGSGSMEWLGSLDVDRQGNVLTTYNNLELILSNDPALKDKIGLNQFSGSVDAKGPLPWNKHKKPRPWSDDDWSALRTYLGNAPYNLTRTPMLEDVMAGRIKHKFAYHPVKEFIESVEWDGVKRVDKLFINYLGVEDSKYARLVTRKSLVACVARIYDPGCKFEYELVLVGPEGKGKSTILRMLGGRWFSDSFNFGMITGGNGKQGFEQIQGFWIIETGEMTGLKNADDLGAKQFIGSQVDSYRPSHGKELVHRPRQCVFFGTTNEFDFMRSKNGNRRFWPLETNIYEPELSIWEDLPVSTIRQIWAEAYALYCGGEELFLPADVEKVARSIQKMHTEHDEREDEIRKFLEMPVGDDWNELSSQEKYNYFQAEIYNGEDRIERISVADLWVQCLGGQRERMTTANTKPIHAIMKNMKGWERGKSKTIFKEFGNQVGYFRKNSHTVGFNSKSLPHKFSDN